MSATILVDSGGVGIGKTGPVTVLDQDCGIVVAGLADDRRVVVTGLPGFDKDDALAPTHVGVVYLAGPDMANYPQGSIMERRRIDGFINLYKKPLPDESDTTT